MNAELHEHLMQVIVDTFKRETDKLKVELACAKSGYEFEARLMRDALMGNGFTQMVNGTWKPPLGKRPDFEGQDMLAAVVAFVQAQRNMLDAARKYEARPK